MPTYDYVCENCGHELEAFQSITAKPLRKCPECGQARLKRQIGAGAGLIFRGSGFYITDYRSSDYRSKAEAETKAATASSEGSSAKGDTKGESKDAGASKSSKKGSSPASSAKS